MSESKHVLVGLWLGLTLAAGCGITNTGTSGDLKAATFKAQNCGGFLGDIAGCDIKARLAVSGKVDVIATADQSGAPLALRSDLPGVLEVSGNGGLYTLTGKAIGRAVLTASNASGDVDHLTIQVDEITRIDYTMISDASGDFALRNSGDIDGTFTLKPSVNNFSLLFLQFDNAGDKILGRETFTTTLDQGLSFQPGKENPSALQIDLKRPTTVGSFGMVLRAKSGLARFKMMIITTQ